MMQKGPFANKNISMLWAISIPVAGHWPVYLEWLLALFVASGVPWTRSCVVLMSCFRKKRGQT